MPVLYDANGKQLPKATAKKPIDRQVAVATIRDNWDTYPSQGLKPGTLATIFKEADQGDILRQMELFMELEEKDARIGASLQTRKLAIQGLSWEIEPARETGKDPTPEQIRHAEHVDEILREISNWDDAVLDALDALGKGYSVSEIIWEISEGDVWIRSIDWVDQRKFRWDDTRTFLRLVTANDMMGIPISEYPNKFVTHKYKARSGKPIRAGILRTCAWMYLFKNYAWKDWVIFAEIYGQPLRLGKYDSGATPEEREVLYTAVTQLGSDAAGIISKATEIEFISAEKTGSVDLYERLIRLANEEITIAILGQTASTQGTPGKLGAEDAQSDVRADLLGADARALAKTQREQIIVPIIDYQFGPQDRYPTIVYHYEPQEDLASEATRDRTLIEAGMPIPVRQMREKYGIDEPQQGEEVVIPWQWRGFSPQGIAPAKQHIIAGSGLKDQEHRPDPDTDDDPARILADAALAANPSKYLVDQIYEALRGATDLGEAQRKIAGLTASANLEQTTAAFRDARLASQLAGRYAAKAETK